MDELSVKSIAIKLFKKESDDREYLWEEPSKRCNSGRMVHELHS